jgi:hypothetical protein
MRSGTGQKPQQLAYLGSREPALPDHDHRDKSMPTELLTYYHSASGLPLRDNGKDPTCTSPRQCTASRGVDRNIQYKGCECLGSVWSSCLSQNREPAPDSHNRDLQVVVCDAEAECALIRLTGPQILYCVRPTVFSIF